ncbi:MAG: TolC family protein [Bacteroidota bacterium]|nr:TolC family protein [Bacteroidota bacterium]
MTVQILKKNTALLTISFFSTWALHAQTSNGWTLQACVEQALSKNISIQQQQLTTRSMKADFLQSKMAALPSINANGTNNWQTGFAINPSTNAAQKGISFRTNSFGISGSMPLFNGFQTVNNMRLQQSNAKASEKDLEQTKNTITLNVCNTYLRVLQSIELKNVALARTAATRAQVERQKKMYELGSSNKSRYLQLKAQLASEELLYVNADNTLMQAYLELWLLIEIKPDTAYRVFMPDTKDLIIEDEPRSIDVIFDEFSKRSPDVVAAEQRKQGSQIQHRMALGGRSPRLTLSGNVSSFYTTQSTTGVGAVSYTQVPIGAGLYNGEVINVYTGIPTYPSYKTTSFGDQFDRNLGTSIGLNLSVPIFNGWNVNNNIQKSSINQESSRLNEKLTRNNLYRSIAQSYVDFKSAYKKFDANKENIDANKEAFDVADKQFELGAMNMADYLNTKNSYIRAEADYTQAKYELLFRRKVLDFYLGKSLY